MVVEDTKETEVENTHKMEVAYTKGMEVVPTKGMEVEHTQGMEVEAIRETAVVVLGEKAVEDKDLMRTSKLQKRRLFPAQELVAVRSLYLEVVAVVVVVLLEIQQLLHLK
ncbi:hypothetical protein ILUMI_06213 [Ignelater luminosus]|uniref:Uncharacterized protein n=1 Tax=Ignelater luminosus TaxID=2038154 RepID=A0A8K0DB52_IGNLU|nr:hypothetical protein ILUMI_06213 [Ignelater luminosus]